ncbi:hypothetical protein TSUD_377670 [Trifolium subterraneum]|uniref:BED-type domain-containing protein n=1 Tax=Trifolium subterraneum TaxID=3900 RepID=A0A2Z6PI29_TRISU|nr:hypothetical protein TSUD_377670 [Trifolium subterraneum]
MEQGEERSQEGVEGQGRRKKDGSSSMQGVVNQGGRSQEVAEGQGRVRIQPTQNTTSILDLTEPTVAATTPASETEATNRVSEKRKSDANGPRQTSRAWLVFNKIPGNDPENELAACKWCHKKYHCSTAKHGTTNMLKHIDDGCPRRPLVVSDDPNQTILTFPTVEGSGMVPVSTKYNYAACRKAVSLFVILDEQPFNAVEGEGFKYLCQTFQPQFVIPSRRTVARDCFQFFMDEKQKLRVFFKSDCNRVTLTTDCWTSIQNLNYIVITAYFVDSEWNYQKRIISFITIPDHKGDTIAKKIEEVLRDWGIRKVSTITVDNASANDVAVGLFKRKIRTMNGLMGDGSFFHMRCNAHILNLIVSDGLKEKDLSISSIRTAARFIKSSSHRTGKFKECIEFAGITCKKGVSLDVSTRWNSTYLMLESAEKFQLAFEKLDEEELSYRDYFGDVPPISYDWDIGRAFATFLKLFYEATLVFSSSQEVSIHSVFHQIADIHCELQEACLDLNSVFASVGKEMVEKYNKYWGNVTNMNKLLYFGVILDPQFKMRIIGWKFKDMYEGRPQFGTDLLASIEAALTNLYNWAVQRSGTVGFGPNLSKPTIADEAKIATVTDQIRKRFCRVRTVRMAATYPVLSIMVRDILAIPVSTVASESAFSTGGRVIETFRSSLKPEMTEALICAQQWLKPTMTSFKDLNLVEEVELYEEIISGGTQLSGDGCA